MRTGDILRNSRSANILKGIRNLVYRKTKMKIEKKIDVSIGVEMTMGFSYRNDSYKYYD